MCVRVSERFLLCIVENKNVFCTTDRETSTRRISSYILRSCSGNPVFQILCDAFNTFKQLLPIRICFCDTLDKESNRRSLNLTLDEMNLFKVVRTVFQIHSKPLLGSKLCFGHHRQIRWESTEVPAAKESANEVSEKVTPTKQSNLMEFFDTGDKLYEHRVVHGIDCIIKLFHDFLKFMYIGRWWHLDDLRIKSNEDLHKLW